MYIGADYYPEHWPESRWKIDAKLMKKAGFNVVRLAEFNWTNMEPEEGTYEFDWLDKALEILGKHRIFAILCTPTAVMPAWVARKYPNTLAQLPEGHRVTWGVRKENCLTSGTFRLLSERITWAMAVHYKDHPGVIGWQTDNELSGPHCYCSSCRSEFQDWLRSKYNSLEYLNRSWGTHFWGHTIRTWPEITIPINRHHHNPSAYLDWQRFHSWLNVRFQRDQVKILRNICSTHFVTHNFMGLHEELSYYDLAKDLDFVSWDNYPVRGAPDIRYNASMAADLMRGLKQKNFWIMEQTAGPAGWGEFGRNPWPGEIRNIAYQQLAHGCDGQVWFRWRTCTAGREQYWHGLLGHDGKTLRRYREATQTAREYRKLEKILAGTTVRAKVGIVFDYQSSWATRIQPGFAGNNYVDRISHYYRALFRLGVNVDMVEPGADLSSYRLILAPNLYILPDCLADQLNTFVRRGGVLLADCRTGVKDENSLCYERTLPGKLATTLGIQIEEYESMAEPMEYAFQTRDPLQGKFAAVQYADWLKPVKAKPLGMYDQWHMRKFAPVTRNTWGKGAAWYVGCLVKEGEFYDQLMACLLKDARIRPIAKPPQGVEVSIRQGQGKHLLFVVNHTDKPKSITVPKGKKDLITGKACPPTLKLGRFGVAVIRL